uniref:Uncharacterized protein n=1 Tax=Romanomermis culicivorax TaxID=13658 RepID=A0A915INX6_ROMCU
MRQVTVYGLVFHTNTKNIPTIFNLKRIVDGALINGDAVNDKFKAPQLFSFKFGVCLTVAFGADDSGGGDDSFIPIAADGETFETDNGEPITAVDDDDGGVWRFGKAALAAV